MTGGKDVSAVSLREVLSGVLGRRAVPTDGDFQLREAGLDSIGMIELLAALERTYGVQVRPEEITPENFETLGSLGAFLEAREKP